MKRLLAGTLTLSLSWLAGRAGAEELQWRPAAAPPAASRAGTAAPAPNAPVIFRGRAETVSGGAEGPATPFATLGRPVPLDAGDADERKPASDNQVRPAAFSSSFATETHPTVIAAKRADTIQPLPIGAPEEIPIAPSPLAAPPGTRIPGPVDTPVPAAPFTPEWGAYGTDPVPAGPGYPPEGAIPGAPDFATGAANAVWGGSCAPCYHVWASAEYLAWHIKDSPLPGPGTGVLDNENLTGGRFTTGVWLNEERTLGLEGSFLFLGPRNNGLAAAGALSSRSALEVWDADVRWHAADGCTCGCFTYKVDLLAGFRAIELNERLNTITFGNVRTNNQFYGGLIGFDGELHRNRWFLGLVGKIALGNVTQMADVNSAFHLPRETRFAVAPEVGLKIGYDLKENLRVYAGYNFLYVNHVARPGDQDLLPASIRQTDFWAHGVSLGLEFRY
jgi:hypothetical protein